MGNQASRRTTGIVIFSDGTVQTLEKDNPTSVAELMLEHPQHFVVEFQPQPKSKPTNSTTSTNLKRPTPLPADHMLDSTKTYVMVPMTRVRTTSMGKIAKIVKEHGKDDHLRKSGSSNLPLLVMLMRCGDDSATAVVRTNTCAMSSSHENSGTKEHKEEKEDDDDEDELQLKENQMRPEFIMNPAQFSSKRWKPNLDPIEEKVKSNRAVVLLQWLL